MRLQIRQSENSKTVSLPEEILDALSLQVSDDVDVFVEQQKPQIIIRPAADFSSTKIDTEFARQISDFIQEYRPALEELAK
jgi:antitoxin component of MazEF toxin-antitoxin module